MISVAEALDRLSALAATLETEVVPLRRASGRVLADPVTARRDQPPFAASSMDGYAVISTDAHPGAQLEVIGESAAGHRFVGTVSRGQAVRIFTGAPVPPGADRVVLQEDTSREGNRITLGGELGSAAHIRPAGADFRLGDALSAPRVLSAADIALLASMNIDQVPVIRQPQVAIIATGDELVQPGEDPGPDQIIASNSFGIAALLEGHGATARLLPIARDRRSSLETTFGLASGADLIVTIGGASVGDHDLVGDVAASLGLEQAFYKIAMRPGKPLMAGRMGGAAMIGLPGNPVSAMVCGHVFLLPVIRRFLGLPSETSIAHAPLAAPLGSNGPRQHYMRARLDLTGVTAFDRQDSSLLTVLAEANSLVIRPPHDPPRKAGEMVDIIHL